MDYRIPLSDEDFEALIEAEPFATGTSRNAHNVPSDKSVVVKKLRGPFLTNFSEWSTWQQIKDTCRAPLFGRCITVSLSGIYLMMERLDDLTEDDRPDILMVPEWVDDLKGLETFGKNAEGEIKLRDYGLVRTGEALAAAPLKRGA